MLPRNVRRGLGRGQGSASELVDSTVDLAAWLAEHARQGRATPGGHMIERFARGQQLDETRVRAAFSAQLGRIRRKLAVDAGGGDEGWQARYDAANRIARNAVIVGWQDLVDAINEVPERQHLTRAQERSTVRTITRVIADGSEASAEELLQAFGAYGQVGGQDAAQLIENQREAELSGTDSWDEVAHALSLARYRETLESSTIEDLQRAAGTVLTAWLLQTMIVMMGTWPTVASRTGLIEQVPLALREVGPSVVERLTSDPVWQQWGRYQGAMRPGSMVVPLAMVTLGLLMLPSMLADVEAYRIRLEAWSQEITSAADPDGLHRAGVS